jgi:hypothetical protein
MKIAFINARIFDGMRSEYLDESVVKSVHLKIILKRSNISTSFGISYSDTIGKA